MRYEKTALEAICFRAWATGDGYMTIDVLTRDLGGPADFFDVLESLHGRGLITLHHDSQALYLTERGWRAQLDRRR